MRYVAAAILIISLTGAMLVYSFANEQMNGSPNGSTGAGCKYTRFNATPCTITSNQTAIKDFRERALRDLGIKRSGEKLADTR